MYRAERCFDKFERRGNAHDIQVLMKVKQGIKKIFLKMNTFLVSFKILKHISCMLNPTIQLNKSEQNVTYK